MSIQDNSDVLDLPAEDAGPDFATPDKQEARAFLRQRFLRFIMGTLGKKADFNLYENSHVSGEFRGTDVDCLEIFVRNLETPLGRVPEAILRATDVISFDINDIIAPE